MPIETLTKREPNAPPKAQGELAESLRRHGKRVRRLRINVAAWAVGTIVLTTL